MKIETVNNTETSDFAMAETDEQFIAGQITLNHDALYRYVYSLIGNDSDTRDVMQETSMALIAKANQFDRSKPFLPWAFRFAYNEVLRLRKKNRNQPLTLEDDVVDLLAADRQSREPWLQKRMDLLSSCLGQLPQADVEIMRGRYLKKIAADDLAKMIGVSRRTLYRELQRIRRTVSQCIETKLSNNEVEYQ